MDLAPIRSQLLETHNLEVTVGDLADAMCRACGAKRTTVYLLGHGDPPLLTALVQTGLRNYERIKLPLDATQSLAGYAAVHRRVLNVADAYDARELAALKPPAHFLRTIDQKTGFRTRQVLVVPYPADPAQPLRCVMQLINRDDPGPFPKASEEAATALAGILAEASVRGR